MELLIGQNRCRYTSVIPATFHRNVDYAQIFKDCQTPGGREAAARYSPAPFPSITKIVICSSVHEADIGTSRMERFNLPTRMTVCRITRLTNAHGKTQRNHDAMLGFYFAWYNFCRKRSTIKIAPAVKAGIVREEWSLGTLLKVAAAA